MLLKVTSVFSLPPLPVMRCQLKKKASMLLPTTLKHQQALRLMDKKSLELA